MPTQDREPISLTAAETEELVQYRSVSPKAISTLVLGIASGLAITHPLMWVLPAVTVLVAWAALRETSPSTAAPAGRTAALVGLCLALLFGGAGVSRWILERQLITRHARQFTDSWIQAVQHQNLPQSLEWTKSFLYRQPSESLSEFYRLNEEAQAALAEFQAKDAVQRIRQAGPDARVEYVRRQRFDKLNYNRRCLLEYRVIGTDEKSFRLQFEVLRDRDPEVTVRPHWQLRSYSLLED